MANKTTAAMIAPIATAIAVRTASVVWGPMTRVAIMTPIATPAAMTVPMIPTILAALEIWFAARFIPLSQPAALAARYALTSETTANTDEIAPPTTERIYWV